MITETVEYTDHNKVPKTRTLHFHISEVVMTENIEMLDKLQAFVDIIEGLQGEPRELTNKEVQSMMDLVKWFMRISYGVKTIEGDFDQDEPAGSGEVWRKFRISNAYSTFLRSLFRPDPFKLVDFIAGVLPEAMVADMAKSDDPRIKEALKEAEKRRQAVDRLPRGTRIVDDVPVAPDAPAASLKAVPEPTDEVDPDMDYDSLLEQPAKRPIKQSEHDFMKERLKPAQFDHFMSTRYVSEDL